MNLSAAAFGVIVARFSMQGAKQEHLWLIYSKGLLSVGTPPRASR